MAELGEEVVRLRRGEWRLRLDEQLGPEGGFGAVFAGSGESGQPVAVKRLKVTAAEAAHRELRIAEELAGASHQHVMPILDAGQDAESDRYYVVMPRAEQSLQDMIDRDGPVKSEDAAGILWQIATGLGEVRELLHRDLKPGNILMHDRKWKVADFGIAKFVEEATSTETLRECLSPPYAAPEQWDVESEKATDV